DDMFAANLVLKTVAVANHVNVGTVDEDFGRARTAVVIRRHHEAVGSCAHHREQVALLRLGHLTLAREEIAALANRTDDVRGYGLTRLVAIDGNDLVIRLVEHGP